MYMFLGFLFRFLCLTYFWDIYTLQIINASSFTSTIINIKKLGCGGVIEKVTPTPFVNRHVGEKIK